MRLGMTQQAESHGLLRYRLPGKTVLTDTRICT